MARTRGIYTNCPQSQIEGICINMQKVCAVFKKAAITLLAKVTALRFAEAGRSPRMIIDSADADKARLGNKRNETLLVC